jgi:hypothetical protein
VIESRREFVWELNASKRPMDSDGNNTLDLTEQQAGYNAGALKKEVLATPSPESAPADKSQDLWFGNYQVGTITGFKFEDVNKDGNFTSGVDQPLANVKMELSGKASKTTLTGADGKFTFSSLVPGLYTVAESTSTDTNNDSTPDMQQEMLLDGTTRSVSLSSGKTENVTYQWRNFVYGSIHGVKFHDLNANGTWDKKSEPPLANVGFTLYKFGSTTLTTSGSGAVTTTYNWSSVTSVATNSHGEFWFTKLEPGT